MGVVARRALVGMLLVVSLTSAAGCRKRTEDDTRRSNPPTAPDRLQPDEIPEGTEMLEGIRLPRRSRVVEKLAGYTVVRSSLRVEQLATYVRAHVDGGNVTAGAASTNFAGVVAKGGKKAEPLEIVVQPTHDPDFTSEMLVRVLPKNDIPADASEAERWRRAGATPDGKLIDRQKLE